MIFDLLLQAGLMLLGVFMFLAMHNIPQKFLSKLRYRNRADLQAKRHFVLGAQLIAQARSPSNSRSTATSLAKQAEDEANKAISLDPKDAASHILKALSLDLQGFRTSALESINVALSPLAVKSLSASEKGDALFKRAELAMGMNRRGRVEPAIQDLTEAVKFESISCKSLEAMTGLLWIMVCYLSLASSSSQAKPQAYVQSINQSSIHLNIYHVHGHGSSLTPNSSSLLSDVLLHDEEHVKALSDRLANKGLGSGSAKPPKSGHLLEPNSASIPLNPGLSIGSGNYYVKLGLGSPPKYYAMILDTGSSLSWLQCQPCVVSCHAQADPLYDPSESKTYKKLSCASVECSRLKAATLNDPLCETNSNACLYTASYGDTSFSIGYLSQDLLTLTSSQTLPQFTYGCGQDNQGLFGRAAGIIGLARDKLSMSAQLSTKYGHAFSYCLPTANSATSGGGFLSIGSISPTSYKFTPMLTDSKNPSLYFLRLTAITVSGRPLGLAAATYRVPTLIDSGTVITRLPMSMYAALRQAFVKIMSTKYAKAPAYSILDTCFKGSLKSISAVPEIKMIFQGGADLTLRAPSILIEADKGITCLAFAGSSGTNQIAIIGNRQQQTYNIAYDVLTSRIGFAPGSCH